MKVSPVLEIPRTEERCPKLIACKQSLCDCLRDGALPRSGEPIQPVDGGSAEVLCPEFDTVQNGPACPLETSFTSTVSILGPTCATEIIEDQFFGCQSFMSDTHHPESRECSDPHPVKKDYSIYSVVRRRALTMILHPWS